MTPQREASEEVEPHEPGQGFVADEVKEHGDDANFIVVGIGASAGGIEALSELAHHVPLQDMAFIVVQHLSPHHESILPQLLARAVRSRDGSEKIVTIGASRVPLPTESPLVLVSIEDGPPRGG